MDKKALILVVDDNAECRALLVWTLERHGFRTIFSLKRCLGSRIRH
jgi:CheY-like chemotaxis protein